MRDYSPTEIAYLQAEGGVRARLLVWITAPSVGGGPAESLGLWNGVDVQTITVEGQARVYQGAGALLDIEPITSAVGTDVRMLRARLGSAAPEVVAAVRGYDLRLAPVEIHRWLTDPLTTLAISPPRRLLSGWIDSDSIVTPALGDEGSITLNIASSALALTRTLTARWSDASMQARGGDRLLRYADVSGSVPVWWGEKRHDPNPPVAAPAAIMYKFGRNPALEDRQ